MPWNFQVRDRIITEAKVALIQAMENDPLKQFKGWKIIEPLPGKNEDTIRVSSTIFYGSFMRWVEDILAGKNDMDLIEFTLKYKHESPDIDDLFENHYILTLEAIYQ
jgi:hypothetical protein